MWEKKKNSELSLFLLEPGDYTAGTILILHVRKFNSSIRGLLQVVRLPDLNINQGQKRRLQKKSDINIGQKLWKAKTMGQTASI